MSWALGDDRVCATEGVVEQVVPRCFEQAWGNMKSTELANLCPDTLDEVRVATESGLTRIGSIYDLCHSFLNHTGLSL